jgi:hypothetical protein
MAKNTIYKVAAAVYDMYCKSQDPEENSTGITKLMRYHGVGNKLGDAMRILNIYEFQDGVIVWKAAPPDMNMINQINEKRKELTLKDNTLAKMREVKSSNEIDQYKDALEKALLRINELEKKQEIKHTEKKSFITRFFD